MLVSKTYDDTTPESAELGEWEDQGFAYEKVKFTLAELMLELKSSTVTHYEIRSKDLMIVAEPYIINYASCTYRSEVYFIYTKNLARLQKFLEGQKII